jgi:hypothetical protein
MLHHLRRQPMDRGVGQFRFPLQRPRRTGLNERQRRERRELRAHHHRPVAIHERGVSGVLQDRETGRNQQEAAHVDQFERRDQHARPANEPRRRIAKQTPIPTRQPRFDFEGR